MEEEGNDSNENDVFILPDETNIENEEELADLPISRSIPIKLKDQQSFNPSVNDALLRSFTFKLDSILEQPQTLYVFRPVSGDTCSLYVQATRNPTSPWKGIRSYHSGKLLQPLLSENREHSLLFEISKNPSEVFTSGIYLVYDVRTPTRLNIDCYLHHDHIINSICDYSNLKKFYTQKEQEMLKTIIDGEKPETIDWNKPEMAQKRRRFELESRIFFETCDELKNKIPQIIPNYKLHVDNLNFQLMPYQKETVQWMLHRESKDTVDDNLDYIYECYNLPYDHTCFYYPHLKVVTRQKLDEQEILDYLKRTTLKGGILADEMGLGKTVQVLSLISSHKKGENLEIYDPLAVREEVIRDQFPNYSLSEQIRLAEISYNEMKNAKRITTLIRYDADKMIPGKTIICPGCDQICSATACGWDFSTNDNESFLCPNCTSKSGEKRSLKTTLIIVPESLIFQWFTEIAKHCSDKFRVMFYFGIRKHGYLRPDEMDKYDVILTTYDTIRAEVTFSDVKEKQRALRRETKPPSYLVSSLVHVNFWRVVVDESQVLPQSVNSQLSTMLSMITGDNWWCVTGTPCRKSLEEFATLLSFLKLKPFGNRSFFMEHLYPQYLNTLCQCDGHPQEYLNERVPRLILMQLVLKIMSRKTKLQVGDQLKLPNLVQIEKRIQFRPVEERQYKEEKDRLRGVVAKVIGNAHDSTYLSDLNCRDRVLHELKSLKELVLTANFNIPAGTGGSCFTPDTIHFQLVNKKKKTLMNNFRSFILNANGLAGCYLLMNLQENALDAYKKTLHKYEELVSATGIQNVRGIENIPKILPVNPLPRLGKEVNEDESHTEEEYMQPEILDRIVKVTGLLKKIQVICKTYDEEEEEESPDDSVEVIEKHDNDVPGPSEPKRPRLEVTDDDIQIEPNGPVILENNGETSNQVVEDEAELSEGEYEEALQERRRQLKHREVAFAATKPFKMDATQEVHTVLNMYQVQVQLKIPPGERISLRRLDEVCHKYMEIEKSSILECSELLPLITDTWKNDEVNILKEIEEFFEAMRDRALIKKDTEPLYYNNFQIRHVVRKDHFPYLPYLALYETQNFDGVPKPKHNIIKCMGGCKYNNDPERYIGSPCLTVPEIMEKTMRQIRKINHKRKVVEEKINDLMKFVLRMAEPATLVKFLGTSGNTSNDGNQMQKMLACDHRLYKGRSVDKEEIYMFYETDNECKFCDVWSKIASLSFEIGLSSFHGHTRIKCGVLAFSVYLIDNFAFGRQKSIQFMNTYLHPFFQRIQDSIKAFTWCSSIIIELINRIHELCQSKTLLTSNQVCASLRQNTNLVLEGRSQEQLMAIYAHDNEINRDKAIKEAEREVRELRYLVKLMEEELTGEKEAVECPVCKCDIESFRIFTCGHRVCQDCLERLLAIAAGPSDVTTVRKILCPTCRTSNYVEELLVARKETEDDESAIPGFTVSVKLDTAIKMMRDIIKNNQSNKILLFTSFEPSTQVWNYLVKVLKIAKLPFAATNRANCGKKIIDFENSEDTKILLCSLVLCANGLNMTGANHLIFLDPPHHESVLRQAIGRIYRFGQKRTMRVYHLIVEGSIDSELRQSGKVVRQFDEKKGWTIRDIRGMFHIAPPTVDN